MLVLGIETTCDETACAIVKDGKEILSNVVASQVELHAEFGGVVPELSCRRHIEALIPVIKQALSDASLKLSDLDLIAVAYGPGLIGALLIGLTGAKTLSLALDIPFIGINHVEAHLYAAIMSQKDPVEFPAIGVVLSGGHTALIKINELGKYQLISETVDDAIGEAFDKVAKMMELPYPGGPEIEALAKNGNPHHYPFKTPHVKGLPLHFSFSGLKTAVLYTLKGQNAHSSKELSTQERSDLAASFQEVAFKDIFEKTLRAVKEHRCKTLIFGGGVTNNQRLKDIFFNNTSNLKLLWPSLGLSLDNAAMIAGLGYHQYQIKGKGDSFNLSPATRIQF